MRALNACSDITLIVFSRVRTRTSIFIFDLKLRRPSMSARPLVEQDQWLCEIFDKYLSSHFSSWSKISDNMQISAIICNVRRYFLPAGNAVKSSQIIREKGSNLESSKYPNLGVESVKGTLWCSQLPCCISFKFFTLLWNTADKYKDQNEPKKSAEEGNQLMMMLICL